jgi:hypothetical protein
VLTVSQENIATPVFIQAPLEALLLVMTTTPSTLTPCLQLLIPKGGLSQNKLKQQLEVRVKHAEHPSLYPSSPEPG